MIFRNGPWRLSQAAAILVTMNDSHDGIPAARNRAAAPIAIALVASAAFGAADQYPGLYSPFPTAVSGMSAPWQGATC